MVFHQRLKRLSHLLRPHDTSLKRGANKRHNHFRDRSTVDDPGRFLLNHSFSFGGIRRLLHVPKFMFQIGNPTYDY